MTKLKMTAKQKTLAKSYKKLGYSEPTMLKSGRIEVTRPLNGKLIVQVINEYGATVATYSRQTEGKK